MKEKQKPQLDCGVDGINIRFASNYELEQDVYRFTRNKRNKEIEYATLKKIKATNEQIEYALYVNLPKILRNTNIQPYSVLDCTKYASVYQFLFDQLTQLFGMNIPELIVTGIECSFSYTLADKELLKPMLNYITRAFISKNNGMHVYVKGVQSKRYEKCEIYCDTLQVQSFRTSRASDCLGSFKCYNKLQEQLDHETVLEIQEQIKQQMKEEGILRFEWILNKRGVNRILGNNTTLWSVLSANSIKALMASYKKQLFEIDQLYDRMNRLGRDIRYVMTGTEVDVILEGINKYLLLLAKKQIEIAFEQAEKEVQDLQQRTKEGIETARRAGKQIGQRKGAVFTVKKAVYAKRKILEHNKTFGGSLNDRETQELAGISRNSLYLYKRELKEEYEQLESIDDLKNKYDKFISTMEKKNQK